MWIVENEKLIIVVWVLQCVWVDKSSADPICWQSRVEYSPKIPPVEFGLTWAFKSASKYTEKWQKKMAHGKLNLWIFCRRKSTDIQSWFVESDWVSKIIWFNGKKMVECRLHNNDRLYNQSNWSSVRRAELNLIAVALSVAKSKAT